MKDKLWKLSCDLDGAFTEFHNYGGELEKYVDGVYSILSSVIDLLIEMGEVNKDG